MESRQVQVGPMDRWSVHASELIGIFYAVGLVFKLCRNGAADRLAKEAAQPGKTHTFRPGLSRENVLIRTNIITQWGQEWKTSTKGSYLRKIDSGLPARYTRKLYGNRPRTAPSADATTHGPQLAIHLWEKIRLPRRRSMRTRGKRNSSPCADGMLEAPRPENGTEGKSWGHTERRVESAGRLKRR